MMSDETAAIADAAVDDDQEYTAGFEATDDTALEATEAPEPEPEVAEPAQEPEIDWRARAEAAAQEARQWQQKYRSDEGRVAAYQRQYEDLRRQIAAQKPQGDGGTPTQAEVREATQTPEKWAAFEKEYPEFAEPMREMMTMQQRAVEQRLAKYEQRMQHTDLLGNAVANLARAEQGRRLDGEYQKLQQAHPDWQQAVQSQAFKSWLQAQPPEAQSLVNSTDASRAAWLVGQFKKDFYLARQRSQAAPQAAGRASPSQRLQSAAEAPRRSVNRARNADDDYAAGFYRDDR